MKPWPLYVDIAPKDVRVEMDLLVRELAKRMRVEMFRLHGFIDPSVANILAELADKAHRAELITDIAHGRIMQVAVLGKHYLPEDTAIEEILADAA